MRISWSKRLNIIIVSIDCNKDYASANMKNMLGNTKQSSKNQSFLHWFESTNLWKQFTYIQAVLH